MKLYIAMKLDGFFLVSLFPLSRGLITSPDIVLLHITRRAPTSRWAHAEDKVHQDSQEKFSEKFVKPDDSQRRKLLKQSSALLAGLVLGCQGATAEDVNKIVLQTSAENAPVKYVDASAVATTTPVMTKADSLCLDSEERRIQVFERTAPSVVFIDTFKEQRDVFSTNV